MRALEDKSHQKTEQVLSNGLAALDTFNASLLTSASLNRLVEYFAVRLSEEVQEQQQQSQEALPPLPPSSEGIPSLMYGSTLDDDSENSPPSQWDAHHSTPMTISGVCDLASGSAFRDGANLETTIGWVGKFNKPTQSQRPHPDDPDALWNPSVTINVPFTPDSDHDDLA